MDSSTTLIPWLHEGGGGGGGGKGRKHIGVGRVGELEGVKGGGKSCLKPQQVNTRPTQCILGVNGG